MNSRLNRPMSHPSEQVPERGTHRPRVLSGRRVRRLRPVVGTVAPPQPSVIGLGTAGDTRAGGRPVTTSGTADPGGRPDSTADPEGRPPSTNGGRDRTGRKAMATILEPMITAFMGPNPPVRVRFWDGSTLGPEEAEATLIIRSPRAVRRIMYAPGELGAARAYV